ncbi:MAG: SDR family NAD(P)-dependent oxidoreductase [Chloroflexi bacterium AL-W]|nr:SDR family NAD(P)-dependent oxidoreductase [Chloroflexi bacterium AL-N1]NOK69960.1 SDR family NAD(P)-dependent oxidoreductase [Chloroflexi bacterium AL-N10]NOK73742.1 SDR family NAD(P)-dependent oxidoreductase [Chloroflexi bacterium AL-N5]NOK85492.1 SDR family NAD(P)-dependent oxidoreductase [Chloroflexi bacterium AL-W]NOK91693.1 SDR family NAD(P)-dependent oxidoreductase [Chloroflexi bacterium AL-N15]
MKHCVITGAADGIGKALAQRFAAENYAITGIDVDAERAEQTQTELSRDGATIAFLLADLSCETDIADTLATLKDRPPIDVLIHNAGINAVGSFADSNLHHQQKVLDINLLAPMHLTAGLLHENRIARGASLVFISSLSRVVSYPGAVVYAASKDGLASYARSLAAALAHNDTHVLTVYPGPTRTAHARRYSPDNRNEQRRMPPERLADLIYQSVQQRRRVLIPGMGNRIFAIVGRLAPGLVEWVMRRTLFEKLQ